MKRAAEVYCTPSAVAALLIAHMHVHDVRGLHGGHRCVYTMRLHSMALRAICIDLVWMHNIVATRSPWCSWVTTHVKTLQYVLWQAHLTMRSHQV